MFLLLLTYAVQIWTTFRLLVMCIVHAVVLNARTRVVP